MSPVTQRLSKPYVPPRIHQRPKPNHNPFKRPLPPKSTHPKNHTQLQHISSTLPPNTERTNPFSEHAAPWAPDFGSHPFIGRVFTNEARPPEEKKDYASIAANHNIQWHQSQSQPHTLILYCDGSKISNSKIKGTGYGVIACYMGEVVFTLSIPLSKGASSYDAEMYAIAHSARAIQHFIQHKPQINTVRIYSDSTSALLTILDGKPHASQAASIVFRKVMLNIFETRPSFRLHLIWTPGHLGGIGNELADRAAKLGAYKPSPLLDFRSKSSRKEQIRNNLKRRWARQYDELSVSSRSGFYPAWKAMRPNPKPPRHLQLYSRELFS